MLKLKERTCFLLFLACCIFLPSILSAGETPLLQEQAQTYRNQGLEFQGQGRLDQAIVCYRKAIMIDRNFVIAYNDLGIVYEAKGWPDRAEQIYLTALKINPNYARIYSNLAMLYEGKKDYRQAVKFWVKRIESGRPGEPWVEEAKQRLDELRKAEPEIVQEYLQEEAAMLTREVAGKKKTKRLKEHKEARRLVEDAQRLYQEVKYEQALSSIDLALSLNPRD